MQALIVSLVVLFPLLVAASLEAAEEGDRQSHFQRADSYTVKVRTSVEYPFLKDEVGSSSGAGFLINKAAGWIATNAHVSSRNPSSLEVAFKGETFITGQLLYVDDLLDLAIIKVASAAIPEKAQEAELACELDPPIGVAVGAYGHPFGLSYSGTRGIVSGTRFRWGRYWIQTDAAINKGNSGGPLISLETGKVIGINSATYSKYISEGIGFAVPMTHACHVIKLLEDGHDPSPSILPVSFAVDDDSENDLIVAAVYKNQRANWPLQPEDRVVALASQPDVKLKSQAALIHALRGKTRDIELIVERSGDLINIVIKNHVRTNLLDRVGVHVSGIIFGKKSLSDDELMNPDGFLIINDVKSASAGELAGLKSYSLLHSIDGNTITSVNELCTYLLDAEASGKEVKFVTRRAAWGYRSRNKFKAHKVVPKNVRLIGPRAPEGCWKT